MEGKRKKRVCTVTPGVSGTAVVWLYRTKSGFSIIHGRLRARGHHRRSNSIIQNIKSPNDGGC